MSNPPYKPLEGYAVYHEVEGLWFETLSDTPEGAADCIDANRDFEKRQRALALGVARVRCVRVEIMGEACPSKK